MSIFWKTSGSARNDDLLGGAMLAAEGVFSKIQTASPFPCRSLGLNLLLSLNGTPEMHLDKKCMPRIQGVYFEVRPDLPCCLIGEGIWNEIRGGYASGVMNFGPGAPRTLPAYDDLIRTGARKMTWRGMMLSFHRCAFEAPVTLPSADRFSWGKSTPLVHFGISNQMNPRMCCIGREFLCHGMLCWRDGRTYFFPAEVDHEIWADFRTSRQFSVENPTPLVEPSNLGGAIIVPQ